MPRRKLTQWTVDQTSLDNAQIVDDDYPNLALRITPTAKSWVMRAMSDSGKPTWSKLPGAFGDAGKGKTTLDAARKEAKRLAKLGGPKAVKLAAKLEAEARAAEHIRVCDIAPVWWQRKVVLLKADTKRAYAAYLTILQRSPLWEMGLRDVRHRHITAWQETVSHTPNLANQALAILKLICKFALLEDWIENNPADKHPRLPEPEPHQPIISTEERLALRLAVEASDSAAKWSLLLQIHTGCRAIDSCLIEPADVDVGERVWTIPAGKFKTKTKHTYPLNAETTLIALRAANWTADLRSKRRAVEYLYGLLITRLGITPSGTHALRRLMASDIAENEGLLAAQHHLGHQSSATTERSYIKARDPRRRAVADAVAQRLKNQG